LSYGGVNIGEPTSIIGFSDADYAANLDKGRSTTRNVFKLWNSTINWKSSLQHVVALSTTKAGYIVVLKAIK